MAQETIDSRWVPWLGCWEMVDGPAGAAMLCVRSVHGTEAVEMFTVSDGEIIASETIQADGVERESVREGCEGWGSTSFSDDSDRLYRRSEHVCEGGARRVSTSLMALVSPNEWVDVQAVKVGERTVPLVQRYRAADPEAVRAAGLPDITADRSLAVMTARAAASMPPSVEDIIEATSRVDPKAVEVWVAEQGEPLELNAARLVEMADAGVPENVIDLIVAVSYPERFTIGLGGGAEMVAEEELSRAGYGRRMIYPAYFDPFYYSYSPWSSYYSPWGYWGGYGYYSAYRPTVVIVDRRQSDASRGRVLNGRGYTRGGQSAGTARSRGGGGGSSASRGTSSGGSMTSSGARSGSSRSSGRTAKRRGGGS
jgi:hypothetical protein